MRLERLVITRPFHGLDLACSDYTVPLRDVIATELTRLVERKLMADWFRFLHRHDA